LNKDQLDKFNIILDFIFLLWRVMWV